MCEFLKSHLRMCVLAYMLNEPSSRDRSAFFSDAVIASVCVVCVRAKENGRSAKNCSCLEVHLKLAQKTYMTNAH